MTDRRHQGIRVDPPADCRKVEEQLMQWWVWLIIVVVVLVVLLGAFVAIQAKRRTGGVIISDRNRGQDQT